MVFRIKNLKNYLIDRLKISDDKVVVVGRRPDPIMEQNIGEKKEEKFINNQNIDSMNSEKKDEFQPNNVLTFVNKT